MDREKLSRVFFGANFSFWGLIGSWLLLVAMPLQAIAHPPSGIVVDGGGTVFYLPHVKGKIRSLAPDGTTDQFVPRRADGRQADDPHKLAMDNAGNLYLMGWGDMWRVSQKGKVSIILPSRSVKALSINGGPNGDKTEETAIFWNTPLAVDSKGNVYCINFHYKQNVCQILRVDPKGKVRIIAGGKKGHRDGKGAAARFHRMTDAAMAIGPDDVLYLTDGKKSGFDGATCIRRVTPDGEVSTLAGTIESGFADGKGDQARFRIAVGLAVDSKGNVYVADSGNRRIRKVTPEGIVTTIAGSGKEGTADGPALKATFTEPTGVALGPKGELYILDAPNPVRWLRKLTPDGKIVTIEKN